MPVVSHRMLPAEIGRRLEPGIGECPGSLPVRSNWICRAGFPGRWIMINCRSLRAGEVCSSWAKYLPGRLPQAPPVRKNEGAANLPDRSLAVHVALDLADLLLDAAFGLVSLAGSLETLIAHDAAGA